MKPLLIALLLAVTAQARQFHSKPAPKPVAVPAEAPAAPQTTPEAPKALPTPAAATEPFTVNPDGSVTRSRQSDSELRDWIEGIQRENALNSQRAIAAQTSETSVRTSLTDATSKADILQSEVNTLTKDRNEQAAAKDKAEKDRDYWHQKDSEAVSKLWWWRIWGFAAGIIGILILVGVILVKFTAWGAKTAAPIIASIAKV